MYIIEVSSEEEFHFMEHEISDALQPPNPKQAKPKQAASPNVTPPRKKVQSPSTTIVRPDQIFVILLSFQNDLIAGNDHDRT